MDAAVLFARKLRWLMERPVEELCKRVQQKKNVKKGQEGGRKFTVRAM